MDLVHRRALGPDRGPVLTGTLLGAETRQFLAALGLAPENNPELWLQALTHGSTGKEHNYERLEFLGDRVLGLVIAEWLYERNDAPEGKLSQRLNALVSRAMCARIARSIGLASHIRLGKQARDDGGADSDNILGDVMEALLGANFLESGFDASRSLVRKLWADAMAGGAGQSKHPKSALQEWAAGNQRRMPEYEVIERSGPDHAAQFTVRVSVHNVGAAEASGSSKQEAETAAARAFMEKFG
jgi:ribonuclease III